jgi:serine/threonine protein phosphatase 1
MERAKVTKEDTLIFLGDYVDGWSQSPQVLDYLIELNTTNNCVFIRGNHDELLHWLRDSKDNLMWYKHGGEATVLAYEKVNSVTKQLHVDTFVKDYYLDEKNRLLFTRDLPT